MNKSFIIRSKESIIIPNEEHIIEWRHGILDIIFNSKKNHLDKIRCDIYLHELNKYNWYIRNKIVWPEQV